MRCIVAGALVACVMVLLHTGHEGLAANLVAGLAGGYMLGRFKPSG